VRSAQQLLFSPTGAFQELAMSNGWSHKYLEPAKSPKSSSPKAAVDNALAPHSFHVYLLKGKAQGTNPENVSGNPWTELA
jgi:hypothetical protein